MTSVHDSGSSDFLLQPAINLRSHQIAPAQQNGAREVYVPLMQHETQIGFGMTVDEVMRRWPATIRVFLDFKMSCVGCPVAGFHTVADTCREHRTAPEDFLSALRA